MHTPTIETLAPTPQHLKWLEGSLPYPVRLRTGETLVSHDDLESAVLQQEFYCRTFDLSDPDQLAKYTTIRQRAVDGWYEILDIQRMKDTETNTMKVWMEWLQNYWEIKNGG